MQAYKVSDNGAKVYALPLPGFNAPEDHAIAFDSDGAMLWERVTPKVENKPTNGNANKPKAETKESPKADQTIESVISDVKSQINNLSSTEVDRITNWHKGKGKGSVSDYVKRIQGIRKSQKS